MYMRAQSWGSLVAANCALASPSAASCRALGSVSQKPTPTCRSTGQASGGSPASVGTCNPGRAKAPPRAPVEAFLLLQLAAATSLQALSRSCWLLLCMAHSTASIGRPWRRPTAASHAMTGDSASTTAVLLRPLGDLCMSERDENERALLPMLAREERPVCGRLKGPRRRLREDTLSREEEAEGDCKGAARIRKVSLSSKGRLPLRIPPPRGGS
mmetsp:Transcript_36830/g.103904  ORF Transcript_36830/g.103904 Transcript_36830/m.103904 type:complete len:214 (-) Transcript_36830:907-1548(-)